MSLHDVFGGQQPCLVGRDGLELEAERPRPGPGVVQQGQQPVRGPLPRFHVLGADHRRPVPPHDLGAGDRVGAGDPGGVPLIPGRQAHPVGPDPGDHQGRAGRVLLVQHHGHDGACGQRPHLTEFRRAQGPGQGGDLRGHQQPPPVPAGTVAGGGGVEVRGQGPAAHDQVPLHEGVPAGAFQHLLVGADGCRVRVGRQVVLDPGLVQGQVRRQHPGDGLDPADQFGRRREACQQSPETGLRLLLLTLRILLRAAARRPRTRPTGTAAHRPVRARRSPVSRSWRPASPSRLPRPDVDRTAAMIRAFSALDVARSARAVASSHAAVL